MRDHTTYEFGLTGQVDLLSDRHLRAVVRIADFVLGGKTDGEDDYVIQQVVSELKPDFCGIWRSFDQEPGRMDLVAAYGCDRSSQGMWQELSAGSQAQYTAFSDSPVVVADISEETRFRPAQVFSSMGLVSGISVPLIASTRCIGVLDVYWAREMRVDAQAQAFLSIVGKIYASAQSQAATTERIARESAQAQVMIEIGKVVGSTLQIRDVYSRFAELVGCLCPCDLMSLSLVNETSGTSRIAYRYGLDLGLNEMDSVHPLEDSIFGDVVRLRRPIVVNTRNQFEFSSRLPAFQRYVDAGLISTLSVPIVWHDRVIAVLTMRSRQRDVYDEHHIALATRVAALVAGAIANSEMHETLDQLASERLKLTEIGRTVNSAPNERAGFMYLASGIGQLMAADRVTLATLGDSGRRLRRRFVSGIPVSKWDENSVVSVADTVARKALEIGRPIVYQPRTIDESEPLNSVDETFRRVGIRTVMYVPLIYGGQQEGIIAVSSRLSNAYGTREISLADRIASLVSAYLARLKVEERRHMIDQQLALAAVLLEMQTETMSRLQCVQQLEEKILAATVCDLFVYCEREDDSNRLVARYSGGLPSQIVKRGSVAATIDALGDVEPVDSLNRSIKEAGLQSSSWISIKGHGEVVGTLGFFAFRQEAIGSRISQSMSLLAATLSKSFDESTVATRDSAASESINESADHWSNESPPTVSPSRIASIVIADAHPACRSTIRVQLAGTPFIVVGECRTIEDAANATDESCDLVVWGLHSADGPARLRGAGKFSHLFRTLVMTDRLSIDGLREALRAGIGGYISRETPTRPLEANIQTLLAGGTVIDPKLLSVFFSRLPTNLLGLTDPEQSILETLTDRDLLILRDLAHGSTNVDIASELNLAVGSVKNRLVEIYRQIGAADRVEATAFAIRAGLSK